MHNPIIKVRYPVDAAFFKEELLDRKVAIPV
jgi:hypothetical protein